MNTGEHSKDVQGDRDMVDYLLGNMSEEAEAQFEESYFADDDLFERFLIVKEELIDDYVQGRLSGSERGQFERRFLNSPQRREQVAFARALKQKFSDPNIEASDRAAAASGRQPWFSFRFPRPLMWAMATVVLAIMGLGWFAYENRRLRAELSAIRAEQSAQSERERELQRQLAQLRASAPANIAAPSPVSAPSPRTSPVPIETFPAIVLAPGLRSAQDLPKATLAPSARRLLVHLLLDDEPEHRSYSVVLRSADNREIERRSGLRAEYKDDSYSIAAGFSAALLDEGQYSVTLFGHDNRGKRKEIGKYHFVTVKQ